MTGTQGYTWLPVALAGLAVVVGVNIVAVFASSDSTGVVVHVAQLAAAVSATMICWRVSSRLGGVERAWRRLMTFGMVGWTTGQGVCSWYRIFADASLPSPSWADVGFLVMPAFALPALLTLSVPPHRPASVQPRCTRLVLVLDALVVVGSLFVLTWSTALGAVVRAGAASVLAFAVAIAYPVTDLILIVVVVLLTAMQRVSPQYRFQLGLLGLGLTALSVSDSAFAYLVSSGAPEMPPVANAGFIIGPALIASAALATTGSRPPAGHPRTHRMAEWAYLLLPYLPVAATGALLVAHNAAGLHLDGVEVSVGWAVIGLVVVRQVITLVENTVLLERVSEGQQRLVYQAHHDPLTGLANRTLFHDRLAQAVERRSLGGGPITLLFVDLDNFKLINDSLGHIAGDGLLSAVGERLRSCVCGNEAVARLGGDEFAVLIEDGDGDAPEQVGERILAVLRQPFTVNGRPLSVSASVGVVTAYRDEPLLTADTLLRRADTAMYVGKRRGKGCVVGYQVDGAHGLGDPDLPNLLVNALTSDPAAAGFEVYYQPIVRLEDAAVVAIEALARWSHPCLGRIEPDVFVAFAERAGVVSALDDFVLDRACVDAATFAERYGRAIDVHVNISATRLGQPELEAAISQALARHRPWPGRLVLEITETSQIDDLVGAVAASRRLRAVGARLAIDDFGAGFNALARLHELPVDIVKLDRTITAMKDPERTEALCRSVLAICAGLRVSVIAEGVQTVSQAGTLAACGCRFGQGYLYGAPTPIHDLPRPSLPAAT